MKRSGLLRLTGLLVVFVLAAVTLLACAPQATPTQSPSPGAPQPTPTAPTVPVQKIIWRANAILSPKEVTTDERYYGKLMGEIVNRTGGRLEIQTHWNNELGFGQRDYPKLLKEGLIEINDLAWVMGSLYIPEAGYEGVTAHLGPAFDLDLTPKVFESRRSFVDEILAEWNGKRLAFNYLVPAVEAPLEFGATKPFRSLAEMKGATARLGGPEPVRFWGNFGVKGVIIPLPEVYLALKTGLVELDASGRKLYKAYRTNEVTKYLIVYGPKRATLMSYGWAASTLHWSKLPPDIQEIVVGAYKELQDQIDAISGAEYKTSDDEWVEKTIKDYGITIIELPSEDLATIQTLADKQMTEWLAKASERGQRVFRGDMIALGRPERYDELMELAKQLPAK